MPKVNIPGVGLVNFPEDMAPADIEREAGRLSREAAPSGARVTPIDPHEPDTWWGGFLKAVPREIGKEALAQAPLLGAAAATAATGGTAALPLMAAAALGGAGGAGLRSIARQLGSGMPEAAGDVGQEMALEGGGQAALEAVPPLLRQTGRGLVKGALRMTGAASREFPGAAEAAIREVIPVGMVDRTARKLGEASHATTQALTAAENAGARAIPASQIAKGLDPAIAKALRLRRVDQAAGDAGLTEIGRLQGDIPANQTLREANTYKQQAGELAHGFFKAKQNSGGSPVDLRDVAYGGLQRGAQDAIEQEAARYGQPDIHAMNARTQDLIGLSRAQQMRPPSEGAINPMAMRHLAALGIGGGAWGYSHDPMTGLQAALVTEGLSNPTVLSSLGIGAGQAGRVPANALRAGLAGLMSSHASEPDPQAIQALTRAAVLSRLATIQP